MAIACEPDGTIILSNMVEYTNKLVQQDLWDYYYYADEELGRIVGMNAETMTLDKEIDLSDPTAHPGSCDRAGYTSKMYARTTDTVQGVRLEVVDVSKGVYLKSIPLNYKPRSSGGYNKYRGLQAISTKTQPYVNVIDVATDTVVITVGADGGAPDGNDGGNATGHTIWLDANHFTLLDRHSNNIQIYKINEDYPPYTTTLTQTIDTLTGCHSLLSVENSHLLQDRTFYGAIEGSETGDVIPQMWKFTFDSATGQLTTDATIISFPSIDKTWGIHHFGIGGSLMAVPVASQTLNGRVFMIDLDTWTLTGKDYTAGLGAGHVDFSTQTNKMAITNHYDQNVTLVDLGDDSITNIVISSAVEVWGSYIQSHRNWISKDGLYFYLFETVDGKFIKIDMVNENIHSSVVVGGTPIQSTS